MNAVGYGRGRRAAALLLSAGLLAAGVLAAALAGGAPLSSRLAVLWPALIPFYLVATHLNLAFQRRSSSISLTLVQLPLALGVVLVAPGPHMVARLVAAAAYSVYRRHDVLKAAYNVAAAALEVGLAALVLGLAGPAPDPGPRLWAALFVGLMLGEVVSHVALNAMFRLLAQPVTQRQLLQPLLVSLATTTTFTGLAVLTISSALTDAWTLVVVLALAGGLAVAYVAQRRLWAQQQTTEDLYFFVKDLGPLDVEAPEALVALEHVRELLHTRHLDLVTIDPAGGVERHLAVHLGQPPQRAVEPAGLSDRAADLSGHRMTTPLLAGSSVVGLLTARQRVTTDRGFDMRDLRLLETIAAELATALDRGRLLRDLGRAATTDPLTGLPNLSRLSQDLDALLLRQSDVIVATVSVDCFREVNDTLGHQAGDALLREVARRLRAAAPAALLGRIGSGRFGLAVPDPGSSGDTSLFGLGLRSRVEGPAQLGAVGTHVRLSVGCAQAPRHGSDAATLLRRAETAMYAAQHVHGGPVTWERAYEVQGQRRLAVVMALREALHAGAVGVAFQPQVTPTCGTVVRVEALARWTHPVLGVIEPDEFVPLAEASGLVPTLTSTVLQQALAACRSWQLIVGPPEVGLAQHGPAAGVGVAVNVSADTVLDAGFVTEVGAILQAEAVPAGLLTLELTEGVVVRDPQLAIERMLELRALGVKLSIDDFGTGYSALTYLKGLPIDEVKIDKSFVDGLVADPGDQAVVRAVVDIGHTLGLSVVAEGVEHEAQHAVLERLGVDQVQGFLHSRPLAAGEISRWLRDRGDAGRRPTGSSPAGSR